MNETTPGHIIFSTIDNNQYLNELYNNILYNYSIKLFNLINREQKDVNVIDSLRFADLLSKSNHPKRSDYHKIWGQEIVALLDYVYPNNPNIEYYLGSVLSNIGNYQGIVTQNVSYKSKDFLDCLYSNMAEDSMIVPAESDKKFFPSQKNIYDNLSLPSLSYSGPTSMGKSFIMRMFIKNKIMNDIKLNFALIVPTKALINEVSHKISKDLQELLSLKNYKIVASPGSFFLKNEHNFIFIMTPERLLYLLINYPNIIIDYLFIDEAHKLSSKDSRSAFYYKTTEMLYRKLRKPCIIFASPNIPNPEIYLKLLHSPDLEKNSIATKFSPVSQMKYYIDYPSKKIYIYNNHTKKLSLLHTIRTDIEVNIVNVINYIGKGHKNIIYCPSKAKAIELAILFTNKKNDLNDKELNRLAIDISLEIHNDCYLASLVKKGVAYHVGYLPASIKSRIEDLYKDENSQLTTLFCTSTLIEGVNLPADNLFITSYFNGPSILTDVDFANLVGRVGRIEHNLYGNVFLTRMHEDNRNKAKKFEDFLHTKVTEQELSIIEELSHEQKQNIVDCLKQGNMEFPKCPKDQSKDNYELMRKFAIILLRDIVNYRNSFVKMAFSEYLINNTESQILTAFENKKNIIDDDINISVDQTESLTEAIRNGLCYPSINSNGNVTHEDLMIFLNKLCKVFKWELYEKSTLGKLCKHFEFHNQHNQENVCFRCIKKEQHKQLSLYAVILNKWISGRGLNWIIKEAIDYKRQNPFKAIKNEDDEYVDYDGSVEHKNIIIGETLDIIENIILFKISNYFLKFSTEYKNIHGPESLIHDWYEYVEYGTTNELSIFFQRNGFSRELANFIKDENYYIQTDDGAYRIKNTIMLCDNLNILRELNDIIYNSPELFVNSI